MKTIPDVVGVLRRFRIWEVVRSIRGVLGRPLSWLVHMWVTATGGATSNLRLKHHFDSHVVHVDPAEIRLKISPGSWRETQGTATRRGRFVAWYRLGDGLKNVTSHFSRNLHGSFIAGGDWDVRRHPFEPLPVVRQLFEEGREPRETDEYRRYLRFIEEGDLRWARGMRDEHELDAYFEAMISAFQSIRDHGYRTQAELGLPAGDEVRVCLSHKGELCIYGGGTHRVSMALALGLDRIPVILKRVHANALTAHSGASHSELISAVRELVETAGSQRKSAKPS